MRNIDEILSHWKNTYSKKHILMTILIDYMSLYDIDHIFIQDLHIKIGHHMIDTFVMYDNDEFVLLSGANRYDIGWITDEDMLKILNTLMNQMNLIDKLKDNEKSTDDELTKEKDDMSEYSTNMSNENSDINMDLRSYIFNKIKDIINDNYNYYGFENKNITYTTRFEDDLGFDSLDGVEFVMHVEKEFNIEISEEEAEKFKTVGDVVKYIRTHM